MVKAWGARQDWFGTEDGPVRPTVEIEGRGVEFLAQRCAMCRQEAAAAAAVTPSAEARDLSDLVDRIHAAIRTAQIRLITIFKVADADEDGSMSPAELQLHMGRIGCRLSLPEAATVVTALDADGDGSVSVQEFITFMRGYRPGQLLRPTTDTMRRIAIARHERVDGYLQASNAALYQEVWRGLCDWLDMQVLRGATCRVKGWCRVVYVDAWRYRGGKRHSGQLPLLVIDNGWAKTHGVRLAHGVSAVPADTSSGQAVAELAPVSLGQRCRVPGTDTTMDRHAANEVLSLLLHMLGTEIAAGVAFSLQLGELGTLDARDGELCFELAERHFRPPLRPTTCPTAPRGKASTPRSGRNKLTELLSLVPTPPNTAPSRLQGQASAEHKVDTGEIDVWMRPTTAQAQGSACKAGETSRPWRRRSFRNAAFDFWRHGPGAYDINMLRTQQRTTRPRPLATGLAGAVRGRQRALSVADEKHRERPQWQSRILRRSGEGSQWSRRPSQPFLGTGGGQQRPPRSSKPTPPSNSSSSRNRKGSSWDGDARRWVSAFEKRMALERSRRYLRQHANKRGGVGGLTEHWGHQMVVSSQQREAEALDEN